MSLWKIKKTPIELSTFGRRLAHMIKELGETQTSFAEKCGMHRMRIWTYINDPQEPSMENVRKIIKALPKKADIRFLITGEKWVKVVEPTYREMKEQRKRA